MQRRCAMLINNEVKLTAEKRYQGRRTSLLLMFVTAASCILAIIMTVVLVWHLAKNSSSENSHNEKLGSDETVHINAPASTCPKLPPTLPLPSRLPKELEDAFQKVDAILRKMPNDITMLPAISANIFYRDSVIWSSHHGSKRYKERNSRPDEHTVYRIGSVTKIFPVLLLYKLYESGIVASIDDPLNKYVPEFGIGNPFTEDHITLREIASQMSGLPREAPCIYHCEDTNSEEQMALLKNRTLVVSPWTMPSYSNLGYALLGRLLTERLLNTTFESWVRKKILEPVGMTRTGFEISPDVEKNMAFPYHVNGTRMPLMKTGWAVPSGGMYSTVSDLAKLGMVFARPSTQTLLKPSSIREMSLPIDLAPDEKTAWGSPFEMSILNGFLIRGKVGRIDSYGAYFSFVPQLELGINVLFSAVNHVSSDAVSSVSKFHYEAYNIILPVLNKTLFVEQDRASFPISAKAFTGLYDVNQTSTITLSTSRYKATISEAKGVLHFQGSSLVSFSSFLIRYIGEPLTFQAKYSAAQESCFNERSGIFADLYFDPIRNDGFSYGFHVPQWSIAASRTQNNEEPV